MPTVETDRIADRMPTLKKGKSNTRPLPLVVAVPRRLLRVHEASLWVCRGSPSAAATWVISAFIGAVLCSCSVENQKSDETCTSGY